MSSTLPCPACVSGTLHTATPKGSTTKLFGLDTYVSPIPKNPRGVILYITDIFGWELPNARLLADEYAEEGGFVVYVPNFMPWIPIKESDMKEELLLHGGFWQSLPYRLWFIQRFVPFLFAARRSVTVPKILRFAQSIKSSEYSNLPLFNVGFCWGGIYSILLSKSDIGKDMFAASASLHPGTLKLPADVENMSVPLAIGLGTEDQAVTKAAAATIESILEKTTQETKGFEFELKWYEGMKHGFAVRGDLQKEEVRKGVDDAKKQVVEWFLKFM
ncbi:Alpha/Beta hydrolase protein [Lipomyces tetrasporus]|uniref:Alpha/Beta hydrolase protein n=1 Tax=Lipomyces tetrasporus TaxID=54092 RepID=A0AAD7QQZ6_9ASCO|nr:Alpha/Beta hydrolase protein [Lipomyces tetrasporus]KAJ8099824.1 Alpha/Beta hydrolase protein [Lipomyces tetrasporus]